jgi:asparagine synthase (glutamine-hydrolysing)
LSRICGILHFDGRPVSPEEEAYIDEALGAAPYTAPRQYGDSGLLMGSARGADTPPSRTWQEVPSRRFCLWDGRLDNREDLLHATGLPAECPESALVLHLYEQKGVRGLADVVGDWSLSIWNPQSREMILASDYAGIRPLYYHFAAGSLYWSSSLADLARWTGVSRLDDGYVGRFLLRGASSVETPYAGILAVPAGHVVRVLPDRIDLRRFWELPVDREIRYADDRQYEEHMLELFQQAVRVRIATGTPVYAELSGGLDSSSVVCMAERLRAQAGGALPAVSTFSYTYENCPDEKYFREVERFCKIDGDHLELDQNSVVTDHQAGALPTWWEPRFRELSRRMAAAGAGVLLTGQLGDLIMGNSIDDSSQVTEWLAGGHLWRAAQEAYAWGRSMQVPLYPILWRSLREACGSWAPPISPHASVGAIPVSSDDSLAAGFRTRVAAHLEEDSGGWRQAAPGRRRRFRAVSEMLRDRVLQTPSSLQHISYAHPYAHRPLVEFMLTIPARVVCRPDQPRRLMRRAFAGLLPPLILSRKSKASYGSTYAQALMPLAAELLRSPGRIQLVELGYVERHSLIDRLEKFQNGLECNEFQLRPLLLLEFWLRNQPAFQETPSLRAAAAL